MYIYWCQVEEGGEVQLTGETIRVLDIDSPLSKLVFQIDTAPSFGIILNKKPGKNFVTYSWLKVMRTYVMWIKRNEWMSEWMIEWVSESMIDWTSEWLIEWVSETMIKWMSEWLNEWMIEWMSDWMNE